MEFHYYVNSGNTTRKRRGRKFLILVGFGIVIILSIYNFYKEQKVITRLVTTTSSTSSSTSTSSISFFTSTSTSTTTTTLSLSYNDEDDNNKSNNNGLILKYYQTYENSTTNNITTTTTHNKIDFQKNSSSNEEEYRRTFHQKNIITKLPPLPTNKAVVQNVINVSMISPTRNVKKKKKKRKKMVFMHIGKASGTTIGRTLWGRCRNLPSNRKKLIHNCWSGIRASNITSEPQISKLIQSNIIHYPIKLPVNLVTEEGDVTDILFSIREPLSRFISWYGHHKHDKRNINAKSEFYKRFFVDCFPTIQKLANALILKIPSRNTTTTIVNEKDYYCQNLARDAFVLTGTNTTYGHLAAGYRFYTNLVGGDFDNDFNNDFDYSTTVKPKQFSIWSVRTEFLWDDLKFIDKTLGGDGNFGTITNLDDAYKYSHGSEKYSSNDRIIINSNESTSTSTSTNILLHVCCALWPEYMAYRQIIDYSQNLNVTQKIQTYQMSFDRCSSSSGDDGVVQKRIHNWDDFKNQCKKLNNDSIVKWKY